MQRALLIAGPTASGKTAYAIERAQASDALIVNTDSMQVYDVLNVLTARPSTEELAQAKHELFGHVDPAVRYSTGAWLDDVAPLVREAAQSGRELIFVGGTGLYFDALINGFAQIPEIAQEVIQEVEAVIQPMSDDERAAYLADKDPKMAARLNAPDPQRVARAISVMEATNRSLADWQDDDNAPSLIKDWATEKIVLNPERELLRARIAKRFELMMAGPAMDEVKALLARELDPSLPAMRAIGVPELAAVMRDEMSLDEAMDKAITATRQYAKRQRTWFRNRMKDWRWIDPFE
ncbi:tRNA (adenosine(37)-N6)-dimethylallyltransferase MiaA [Maritalea mediterranea]|uniref:tRNA dimethylallyltransferase n=1 Tax=Maritalea mediterranea TaxID=2909667 RepID=A0ABS9E7P1_9HYPH|nr:tRNA (adenosine(37)-N6)-dimethylallyltransferase MiaA [Maritalea mediterranea]MCF4098891.1 tRNA (adenosine(37)-N6)-dimethylallyltransferase MiaA [Maritalea mediterranea]